MRLLFTGRSHLGWAKDWELMRNDFGAPLPYDDRFDRYDPGGELDEAFRRGRKHFVAVANGSKTIHNAPQRSVNQTQEYINAFWNGYCWEKMWRTKKAIRRKLRTTQAAEAPTPGQAA